MKLDEIKIIGFQLREGVQLHEHEYLDYVIMMMVLEFIIILASKLFMLSEFSGVISPSCASLPLLFTPCWVTSSKAVGTFSQTETSHSF